MSPSVSFETRQAQLFMQIHDRFQSPEFAKNLGDLIFNWKWRDFDDYMSKYGAEADIEKYTTRTSVGSYFEGLGALEKRGLIDPYMVDDLLSTPIIMYWEKMAPILREWRKRTNYPQLSEWSEYLYDEIKGIAAEQHPEIRT